MKIFIYLCTIKLKTNKTMKVRAIVTIPNMKDIFVEGDILELEVLHREEDVELFPARSILDKQTGKWKVIIPAVIAKKGEFYSYVLIVSDGRRYSESCIHSHVGYKPLKEMFEKFNTENLVVQN